MMFRNLPDSPPPVIPNCPVCGQPMQYYKGPKLWICRTSGCQGEASHLPPYEVIEHWRKEAFAPNNEEEPVFSLAAYEASEREKARRLAELDNAVEDDDYHDDEDWFDEW